MKKLLILLLAVLCLCGCGGGDKGERVVWTMTDDFITFVSDFWFGPLTMISDGGGGVAGGNAIRWIPEGGVDGEIDFTTTLDGTEHRILVTVEYLGKLEGSFDTYALTGESDTLYIYQGEECVGLGLR